MSSHKRRRKVNRPKRNGKTKTPYIPAETAPPDLRTAERRERRFEIIVICLLLLFATYHSVLYFGYKVVPTSDFPAFVQTGHELLAFKIPSNFTRAPVLGLLQAAISHIVGGRTPDLTAGRVLNAVLHPLIAVLLYLVGKAFLGRLPAVCFTIIMIINPWTINLMTDPIAETTLLFFGLLTIFFLIKRSRWSYLFASITTMVRYEGAALILAAFVMDVITNKSAKERLKALLLSALATLPFAIWMICTFIFWKSRTAAHYIRFFTAEYAKLFSESLEERTGLLRHLNLLWRISFHPLFVPPPGSPKAITDNFPLLSQVITSVTFLSGLVYASLKRSWAVLSLLIFLVPYIIIHAMFPYPMVRFYTVVHWIALLISMLGLKALWELLKRYWQIPKPLIILLQTGIIIGCIFWIRSIFPFTKQLVSISPKSAWFPYIAIAVVVIVFTARAILYQKKCVLSYLAISALLCLVIFSNQFGLVNLIRDGQQDAEFAELADWYVENAKPEEKMALYLASVVKIFAPNQRQNFVRLPKADNRQDFVRKCYESDITYVVWATREARSPHSENYKLARLDNIAHLVKPTNSGPYQFVTQLGTRKNWINVFRLRRP